MRRIVVFYLNFIFLFFSLLIPSYGDGQWNYKKCKSECSEKACKENKKQIITCAENCIYAHARECHEMNKKNLVSQPLENTKQNPPRKMLEDIKVVDTSKPKESSEKIEREKLKIFQQKKINGKEYDIFEETVGANQKQYFFFKSINGREYKYILVKINDKEYTHPSIDEQVALWKSYYAEQYPDKKKNVLKTLWIMAIDYACQPRLCPEKIRNQFPVTMVQYKDQIIQLAYSVSLGNVSRDLTFGSYGKAIQELYKNIEEVDIQNAWNQYRKKLDERKKTEEEAKKTNSIRSNDTKDNYATEVKSIGDKKYAVILYPQGAFKYTIALDLILKNELFPIAFGLESIYHPHGGGVDNTYRLMLHDFTHADAYYKNFPKDKLDFIKCIYSDKNRKLYLVQAMIFYFLHEIPLQGNFYKYFNHNLQNNANLQNIEYLKQALNGWAKTVVNKCYDKCYDTDLRDLVAMIKNVWPKAFKDAELDNENLKDKPSKDYIQKKIGSLIDEFTKVINENSSECIKR